MSYTALEKQIRKLPEDCLEELSHYIDYLLYRHESSDRGESSGDLSRFFGNLANLPDGLEAQREMRDEWN